MNKQRLMELAGVKGQPTQLNETMWGDDDIEDLYQGLQQIIQKHNIPDHAAFMEDVKQLIQQIGVD